MWMGEGLRWEGEAWQLASGHLSYTSQEGAEERRRREQPVVGSSRAGKWL